MQKRALVIYNYLDLTFFMTTKKKISICLPCFNEEDNINNTYSVITHVMSENPKFSYELIFVDNGSYDKTSNMIKKLAKKDKKVIGIFLSRNFGPESSGHAAIFNASGDAIIGMGADLQDPPDMIPKFINKWQQGYDVVLGTYQRSEKSIFMSIIRKVYYTISRRMTSINFPPNTTGFGLIDRKVLDALKSFPEKSRFGRGLLAWVGYRCIYIPYKRKERKYGKSSYTFFDYLKHAETGLFGFSTSGFDDLRWLYSRFAVISFYYRVSYHRCFFRQSDSGINSSDVSHRFFWRNNTFSDQYFRKIYPGYSRGNEKKTNVYNRRFNKHR